MKLLSALLFLIVSFRAIASDDPIGPRRPFKLPAGVTAKDYLPNTLIVKFKPDTNKQFSRFSAQDEFRDLKVSSIIIQGVRQLFPARRSNEVSALRQTKDTSGLDRIFEVRYEGKRPIEEIINEIQKDNIEYAEPSYIYYTQYTPNDPFLPTRQSYFSQLKATEAWDIIKNSSNVVIGIVDSGSDLDHPDLAANIFLNTADPVNGLDDDRDGFIDNFRGWDLIGESAGNIREDNDPSVTSDSTAHGVHVSGIASAVTDNGFGVSSLAFNAKLLIVKVGADNDSRSIFNGYQGIKYAADHGAQIINCSWGGPGGGSFGIDIISYAISKGCLIVAAAGNDNRDVPDYPAAYDGVLSVTSVSNSDLKSSFSNFGPTVDIAAPGSSIYSTQNDGSYGLRSGTSMSTPLVASAAALVKARFPELTMLQVGEQLRITSDNVDRTNPAYTGQLGKGRLNLLRAVTEASPSIRNQKLTVLDKANGAIPVGDTIQLFFDLKNFLAPASGLVLNLSTANSHVEILNNTLNLGALNTLESKLMVGPFRVFVRTNASDNEEIEFRLSYTSNNGNYQDFELFNVIVSLDYLNVDVNKVASTITSNGRVGYSSPDQVNGLGFIYKGKSLLYEASLMIGRSATQVSNNTRNDTGGNDEHFMKQVRVKRVGDSEAAFEARSEFNDSNSPVPLNIYVNHRQLAYSEIPDDKYIIVEYEVENLNTTAMQGVYIGLFSDWDIDGTGRDATGYDELNRMGYAYGRAPGSPYAGVKLLKSVAPPAYYPLSYQVPGDPLATGGGLSLAEKYQTLSSGIKSGGLGASPANGYDVMFVLGSGPYTIPAKGSVRVAFAFIGGDNLEDLKTSAVAAENKYRTLLDPVTLPTEGFVLKQNYPNPAADRTIIEFSVPEENRVGITLYNAMGKRVRALLDETLRDGTYRIDVDLSDLKSGVYFYRLNFGKKELARKMLVVK